MRRLRPVLWLLAGLVPVGCDTPQEAISEREDFRLRVPGVVAPGFYNLWTPPYVVLQGTRICPELVCSACPDKQTCDDAAIVVSGAIVPDGDGCFVAEGAGEAVWTVGSECGAPGLPPDRVVMRVAEPEDTTVQARHENAPDEFWSGFGVQPAGAEWPGDVAWPLKVVAESQVAVAVLLVERESGIGVAHEDAAQVSWTTTRGRAPIAYPGRTVELVAFAGTEAEATLSLGGYTWPLGKVVGVTADAAESLEIAAGVARDDETGEEAPVYARAVARDAEGALLSGMPVRWSVRDGELAVLPDGHESVWFDDCRPPDQRGGPREAVLTARYGDLAATLTLRWQGAAGKADPDWSPSAWCTEAEGCDCRQSGGAGGLAWLMLAGGMLARRRRRLAGGAVALAVALPGCASESPVLHAKESLELGDLPLDGLFREVDGGQSARFGERSLWMFYVPAVEPARTSSLAATLADVDGSDGLYPFARYEDEEGDALSLIPLTDAEASFNAEHGGLCGAEDCSYMAIWPGSVIHDPARSRLLIFYAKRILRDRAHEPTFFEQLLQGRAPSRNEYVGTGIAVWRDDLDGRAARPHAELWADEPTLLFRGDEPRVGAAALVDGEFLYSYACDGEDNPCIVARVPLADALSRDAWRFYDRSGGWSDSYRRAEELFGGAPTLSVHYSDYAGVFVAAYAVPGTASVALRTAPRPEGPWSDPEEIHRAFASVPGETIRSAVLHPELAREGGAIDYLTYFDTASASLRLVEIAWWH